MNKSVPQANNPMAMVQQIKQFQQTFNGDPQAAVMQMLNSGQVNNAQLQQAMQMARQIGPLMK